MAGYKSDVIVKLIYDKHKKMANESKSQLLATYFLKIIFFSIYKVRMVLVCLVAKLANNHWREVLLGDTPE